MKKLVLIAMCMFFYFTSYAIADAPFSEPTQDPTVRYRLFPTQNMYNFILLDQIDGYTYQVQWHGDEENRGVVPISY